MVRRGLERYSSAKGHDLGPMARQRYVDHVVHKAGLIPGDWALDVQTGNGLLGNSVGRAFTRVRVVAIDEDRANLEAARENAKAERCIERMRFVQCAADALPFKDESFYFVTIGFHLPEGVGELSVLEEVHRTSGYTAKVYAPSLEYPPGRPRPEAATVWQFDKESIGQVKELAFGKLQKQRVAMLPDGGQLYVTSMKRFDPEEDEGDVGDEEEDAP